MARGATLEETREIQEEAAAVVEAEREEVQAQEEEDLNSWAPNLVTSQEIVWMWIVS